MIVQNTQQYQAYIHKNTTNRSFLEMHYFLKDTGINNNAFHLIIFDYDLQFIDPRDPKLNSNMKARVLKECMNNYWYFIREIVRIPVQGGAAGSGIKYGLHRGNLALNFGFTQNWNMMQVLPRQTGKTIAAISRYLWCYNFGTTNSEILFGNKKFDDSKLNLQRFKDIRAALPDYLQMNNVYGRDGKKIKVKDSVETIENAYNNNKIKTMASARNKVAANSLGRGCTVPIIWFDEFAFITHNGIIFNAASPAFKTASMNARSNNKPYGILLTTTPGDLTTEEGQVGLMFKDNATRFNETMYDMTGQQLNDIISANTNSDFMYMEFSYQQVGRDETWFREIVITMQKKWSDIRREVLLEWSKASDNSPFSKEDLNIIKSLIKEPKRTIYLLGKYPMDIYLDLDLRNPPLIGVDVSGGYGRDSSTITVVDSKTTALTADFNCNYISPPDLAKLIYELVTRYMPNAVVNIERNGGFGASVIASLLSTKIKRNLYYEIKERVVEERTDNFGRIVRKTSMNKVYGLDSTKKSRETLFRILGERVNYHKDKFVSPRIMAELETLEVKRNGRWEHASNAHDDQLFSYMLALYVWYEGKDLRERFGIMKSAITTDQDAVEAIDPIEEKYDNLVVEAISQSEDVTDQLKELKIIGENRIILNHEFEEQQRALDNQCMANLMSNPVARKAWARQTGINEDEIQRGYGGSANSFEIPSSIFDEFYK